MNILKVPASELNLKAVLLNGQTFRWRNQGESYYGVVEGFLLHLKRQDEHTILWACIGRTAAAKDVDISRLIHDYFQLDVSLEKLWDKWSAEDRLMAELRKVKELQGIRILKQDPFETLLAFICSSNNNIPRISTMVNKLAMLYGDLILLDPDSDGVAVLEQFPELCYSFPSLAQLTAVQPELAGVLQKQLFGYRARSVSKTVLQLSEMSPNCLEELQRLPCKEIRRFLLGFSGVGPKVAECVALMSLGQNQCVPIDRHVFEITKKYYMPALKFVNLTFAVQRQLMNFYERKFGPYAGWAQAALFTQQLEKYVHPPLQKNGSKSTGSLRSEGDWSQKKPEPKFLSLLSKE